MNRNRYGIDEDYEAMLADKDEDEPEDHTAEDAEYDWKRDNEIRLEGKSNGTRRKMPSM